MSEREPLRRDAITRARFFLEQARSCRYSNDMAWQESFEAYLEAAIVFSRAAVHRLHTSALRRARGNSNLKAEVDEWWHSILKDPAIQFFRVERDFIVKEGPPKVGQILYGPGGPPPFRAEAYYYYEDPNIPATDTIERHLNSVEKIVTDAERRFGTSSLSGRWWED
jgi:hypothetical protein